MAATSYFGSFLVDNGTGYPVRVRYIRTWVENIAVKSISSNTVNSSGEYGINGTFFGGSPATLVGIAINHGAPVRTGGEDNDIKRGTLYRLSNGIVDAKPVDLASTITGSMSDLKWAIGGISLYLERSFANEDAFFYDISSEIGSVDVRNRRPRTAIGYNGVDQIYLVTFCNDPDWTKDDGTNKYGLNLYQVHQVMKTQLGCVKGVNLDGGGSTAIAYKSVSGGTREVRAVQDRSVLTMVTVPAMSFDNIAG